MQQLKLRSSKISLVHGDITKIAVDAIVNAANSTLLGGGGVDGAIHEVAGPELLEECKNLNGCEVGEAKITRSYGITNVKYIIHTVGPRIRSEVREEDKKLLSDCYRNSLNIAKKNHLRSIAFPCISTGLYHFPKEEASKTAVDTVIKWLTIEENASAVDEVKFCSFNDKDKVIYQKRMDELKNFGNAETP